MTQTSSAEVYSSRLNRLRSVMTEEAVDLTLLSVGPDLPYFIGYEARPSERLTMLAVRPDDDPLLFMPRLEVPKVGEVPVEIVAWDETTDPLEAVGVMASSADRIAIGDHTWSMFLVGLLRVNSDVDWMSSSRLTAPLRIIKDEIELGLIRQAAEAVDRVLARIPGEVKFEGRSEKEVASQLLVMTVAEGSDVAAHCIVGTGPNGASPHHDPGPRAIANGDLVVCDFGGRVGGYHSDVTRTFSVGEPEPFASEVHEVVKAANRAGREAVSPGVECGEIDEVTRTVIEGAGYGEFFVHRTGHGIGLEIHEQPYLVAGNTKRLEAGMTFSIEPGIYLPDQFGVRIEDIVACSDSDVDEMNQAARSLIVVG